MNTITKESLLGTEICTNQTVIIEPNLPNIITLSLDFSDSVKNNSRKKKKKKKQKQPTDGTLRRWQ